MSVNHPTFGTFCCICFAGLTPSQCAVDQDGVKWDVCSREVSEDPIPCAEQAGIVEKESD